MTTPVQFRILEAPDEAFVYNAWLKSYKDSPCGKTLINDIFYGNHKLIVKKLMEDPLVNILLAVNPDDRDQIYGFACVEKTPTVSTLHYVYTKYNFRQFGIAKAMVTTIEPDLDKIKFMTHLPRDWRSVVDKFNILYNPYLLKD